jgi:UDP-N-acetylglucosamine--N-acetylmuramyl-(pentapeptide) pyrophosphoryl-undecaprenol N-acetylglucosamine transferase
VVSQRALTPQYLAERLSALLSRPDILVKAAEAARHQGRPDAAERFAALVIAEASPAPAARAAASVRLDVMA